MAMTEEEALVSSFVAPQKRERLLELLANPKRRTKVTRSLAHFKDLDPRWVVAVPPSQHDSIALERLLRSMGAGDTCHVVSESSALDGRRLPLRTALEEVIGRGMGTLVSCVP